MNVLLFFSSVSNNKQINSINIEAQCFFNNSKKNLFGGNECDISSLRNIYISTNITKFYLRKLKK